MRIKGGGGAGRGGRRDGLFAQLQGVSVSFRGDLVSGLYFWPWYKVLHLWPAGRTNSGRVCVCISGT